MRRVQDLVQEYAKQAKSMERRNHYCSVFSPKSPTFSLQAPRCESLPSCILLLCGPVSVACGQTPIPKFTGDQLYLVGVAERYRVLEGDLRQVQDGSRQTYYVVVVASTGSGEWATREYIDRLYSRWQSDAQNAGLDARSQSQRDHSVGRDQPPDIAAFGYSICSRSSG